MNFLPNELLYEILSHLSLNVIIPLSILSTNFNLFIRGNPFWIVYVKNRNQYQYRKLFDQIVETKHTWLFEILHLSYEGKVLDRRIKENCYYNAYINENEVMMKHIGGGYEYINERKIHKIRKLVQEDHHKNYLQDAEHIKSICFQGLQFYRIISYCREYSILLIYNEKLNKDRELKYNKLLKEIIKCNSKYSFNLFREIIEHKNINLIKLKKYIFQSPNKDIIDYFIEKTNTQFNYENIMKIIEEHLPIKCEYYIIKYYNDNILSEDEEIANSLWYILEWSYDIIDDDLYIDMIETLCKKHYNKKSLENIYDITDDSGYFYINMKIKAIPSKFGKEELEDNWLTV